MTACHCDKPIHQEIFRVHQTESFVLFENFFTAVLITMENIDFSMYARESQ